MTNLRRIVRKVLEQLANSQEAQHYLKEYSNQESLQFAIIKVGGGILKDELEALATALSTIRHLGLFPVVVHGAGTQIDTAVNEAGIKTQKLDGLRVTTEEVMAVARPVIYKANRNLVAQIKLEDVEAIGILHGVFSASYQDKDLYGLVGKIDNINLDSIRDAAKQGALPIIACLGETESGQVVNINADIAARELVWALKPRKIIYLTPTGGLLNESGALISSISLLNDYESLMQTSWVHSGMRLKLEQIKTLLTPLPKSASVSITSVSNLLKELFTHRGAGTLVNKGEHFHAYYTLSDSQKNKLKKLIEASFARELRHDYFEKLPILAVLTNESVNAAAIVIQGKNGIPYLDKFTVAPEAQGFGYAAVLWRMLKESFPQLYWRSKISNPISTWYLQKADTSYRENHWYGFSYGIRDAEKNQSCLKAAINKPITWIDK